MLCDSLVVVIEVGPDVAVRVENKAARVVLYLHGGVLTEPRADAEDEEHPARIAVKLAEPPRNKATEHHLSSQYILGR